MAESKLQQQQQQQQLKKGLEGTESKISTIETQPACSQTETMQALAWRGSEKVELVTIGKPLITQPADAIIKVTSTSICGSDLHLYRGLVDGLKSGDILGHEFMGIVEDIGPEVKNIKKGDRVVIAFDIACGGCNFCKQQMFSACEITNDSMKQKEQYGQKTGGIFGYSHLTGGFQGGQAEYVRVPYADTNALVVPSHLKDDQVLLLSDVPPTAWHANELGKVGDGDNVAVWGCGPVGLMAIAWAKLRGANTVIAIDNVEYRLSLASSKFGAIPINCDKVDVVTKIQELLPGGCDVCIDAAGFEYSSSFTHKIQRFLHLEHDSMDIINQCIKAARKYGRVSVVGVYVAQGNMFEIGDFMEKGLTMAGGQTPVQKYWKELLGYVEAGKIDPTFIITHHMWLEEIAKGYRIFSEKEDNCVKVVLRTKAFGA